MTTDTDLEEKIAHLTRMAEDLSDTVVHQSHKIERLEARVKMLLEREAERETASGTVPLADQKPPHW